MSIIIFDVETTGFIQANTLLERQPQIIEFAAIKVGAGFKELERLDFLCGARAALPEKITEITGITDADIEGLPTFGERYQEAEDFFGGAAVCFAHNLEFDKSMIDLENSRLGPIGGFPWPKHQGCTMRMTSHIERRWMKLEVLYQYAMGRKMANAHRAMADVEATLDIVKWMKAEGMF